MNITLHQAAEDVRGLLEQIDPESGELPEGFEQARAIVATKSQAVAGFILSNNAEADMVETYAKTLLDRVKTARKRSDWLKRYLLSHMQACGITQIKSDDGTFKAMIRDNPPAVDIFDQAQLPQDYMREIPVSYVPDKTLIAKALKDQYDVPGAKLTHSQRLEIK